MKSVISVEQAIAAGHSPEEIGLVAEWHEQKVLIAERKDKPAKRAKTDRHRRIAAELRGVAGMMQAALTSEAA